MIKLTRNSSGNIEGENGNKRVLKAGINVFTAFTLKQITGERVNETLLTSKPGKLEF